MWRNWSSACTMIRKIWKNPRQKQKLCDIKLFGSLKVVLNDKRAKWLNKACFIFGQRTRYNHLIVREWLFWIFCITNINASDSEQASEISALSTVLSLMHLNVFCNMRNCLNYFRHRKTKFIYSGFGLFKNTWYIWNILLLTIARSTLVMFPANAFPKTKHIDNIETKHKKKPAMHGVDQ